MLKLLKNKTFVYLTLILVLGLFLRLLGANHGYPFVFHPDEPTIIQSALGIRFEINPAHFDWPHFYIYFNYFVYVGFSIVRRLFSPQMFPLIWDDSWIFYLLTRIVSAIFGALTLIPIYLSGREAFNKKAGLFAALALMITPLHITYSHYALNEMPMVFFLSWGVYFSLKILLDSSERKEIKNYIFAGLFFGLSASSKYNGGLSSIMVPLATLANLLSNQKIKTVIQGIKEFLNLKNIYRWSVSGIFAILGFLIGTPFALFDFDTFTRTDGPKGALWQFQNVGSVSFAGQVNAFFHNLLFKISDDLGYTFLIGFFVILLMVLFKLVKPKLFKFISKQDLYPLTLLLFMGLYFLWYVSGFAKSRSHYYMISYPYIILVFGYLVSLFENIKSIVFRYLLTILVFSIPLFMSFKFSYVFYNTDTRVELFNWLKINNQYSQYPYVFEVNALKDIFEKAKVVTYKNGFDQIEKYNKGIIIFSNGETFENINYKLELINTFDNKLRRGPLLKVYTFEKI